MRIGLGVLSILILATTIPAYFNTANNPALATLSGEVAGLGSVAGAFLARQLALALIALYGAVNGTRQPMLIGAFAMAFFNLHDALFLTLLGNSLVGAVAGLVLGGLALVILVVVFRQK